MIGSSRTFITLVAGWFRIFVLVLLWKKCANVFRRKTVLMVIKRSNSKVDAARMPCVLYTQNGCLHLSPTRSSLSTRLLVDLAIRVIPTSEKKSVLLRAIHTRTHRKKAAALTECEFEEYMNPTTHSECIHFQHRHRCQGLIGSCCFEMCLCVRECESSRITLKASSSCARR